jgi:hypothetical protein
MDEGIGTGQDGCQHGDVGDEGDDVHPLARGRHRSGADRQQDVRRAEPRHRIGEDVEVLLGREAAGVDEHACVGGQAELGAPTGRRGAPGMEQRGVDAERLQGDALHAPVEQMAAHAAARREHEVEAAIDVPGIAARGRRGEAAEAGSGGEPGHRLEVGVAGRDRGDGERARGVEPPPGDAVGIAGFDQVRPQVAQHPRDRAAAQRQAIAAAAGQGQGGQAGSAGNGVAPGHGDRVPPARPARQPVVLGQEVAAHAAAGRAPEHRRVDDVNRLGHSDAFLRRLADFARGRTGGLMACDCAEPAPPSACGRRRRPAGRGRCRPGRPRCRARPCG